MFNKLKLNNSQISRQLGRLIWKKEKKKNINLSLTVLPAMRIQFEIWSIHLYVWRKKIIGSWREITFIISDNYQIFIQDQIFNDTLPLFWSTSSFNPINVDKSKFYFFFLFLHNLQQQNFSSSWRIDACIKNFISPNQFSIVKLILKNVSWSPAPATCGCPNIDPANGHTRHPLASLF